MAATSELPQYTTEQSAAPNIVPWVGSLRADDN